MTYSKQDDRITLEMTGDDFDCLLIMLGAAIGSALRAGRKDMAYLWLEFTNKLNNGNSEFTPYEIPTEHEPSA